jgi:CHAT domain-containing protein
MSAGPQLNLDGFEALAESQRAEAVSRDPRGAAAALVALGDECERVAAAAPDRALRAGAAIAAAARAVGAGSAEARALRATIPALAYAGRLDEALVRAAEAEAAADRAQDAVERARAGVASMHALAKLGRTDEAIARGRASRDALNAAGRADLAARAELNLANVHKIRGEQDEALACLERALGGIPEAEAAARGTIENTLGETLLQLDRLAEAHGAFDRAEKQLVGLPLAHAVVVGNRADLFAREGRFGDALREFARASQMIAEIAPGHHARLLLEEAEALAVLGAHGEALEAVDAALATASGKGLKAEMSRGLLVRARALAAAERVQEAKPAAARALALAEEIGDARGMRAAALVASELALREGEPRASADFAAKAMRNASPLDSASALVRAARAELAMGNTDRALETARSARSGAAALGVRTVEIDAALVEADSERARGGLDRSIAALSHAIELAEDLRGSLAADRLRSAFAASRLRVYEDLALDLLARADSKSLADAFVTVERARSRVLLDAVLRSIDRSTAAGAVDGRSRDEIARVRARLAALHASVARSASDAGERRGVAPALLDELRAAEQEMERLVTRVQNARGVASLFAQPLAADEVLARLEHDDAMIAYFIAGEELMAFVARKDGIASVRCIAHASEIGPLVDKLLYQLRAGVRAADARSLRAVRVLARMLHELLIAPILEQVPEVADARRLVVVPFGALHALPFAALFDGEKYLIERFEIHTAPSASIACSTRAAMTDADPRDASTPPLVVAVADENAPLIDEEADLLVRTQGADVLRGDDATIDRVRDAARGRAMLHFACHGRFIGALPNASGLRLSDGWLPVREIVELELDAQVVFLSACETGRNAVDAGDELAGISRAFLAAGARCLVAGLWSVRDHAALETSANFHQEFSAGRRPSAALRAAALASLKKWEHPSWWAPFVVTGSLA